MQITAATLAQLLDGKIEGDEEVWVNAPSKIEEGIPNTISFLANPKYEDYAYTTKSSILLVSHDFQPKFPISATLIRVKDVYKSIAFLLEKFGEAQKASRKGISKQAVIADNVEIEDSVSVGAFAVLEEGVKVGEGTIIYPQVYLGKGVVVGKGVVLYAGVKIYHDCVIGDNCIVHANVVIGSDGFGFVPNEEGIYKKVPQIGNVVIEDDVEIGANTVIDRATMGHTVIKKGVKLDNLIQIAHNVEIGQHTAIAAQAGIAGSTKIGDKCLIGGQAGFVGHIKVANGSKIQAQSGVATNISQEGTAVYGSPALSYANYLKSYAVFKQLPDLNREINRLKKEIEGLKKELNKNL